MGRAIPNGEAQEVLNEKEQAELATFRRYAKQLSQDGVASEMSYYEAELDSIGELMLAEDDQNDLEYLGARTTDLRRRRDVLNSERHSRQVKGLLWNDRAVGISADVIEQLRDSINLVEVVQGAGVSLEKRGREFWGRCPFGHEDKTPSFHVNVEKGVYFCHGCGRHGDVFSWLMHQNSEGFPQAVRRLADALGVELPKPGANA